MPVADVLLTPREDSLTLRFKVVRINLINTGIYVTTTTGTSLGAVAGRTRIGTPGARSPEPTLEGRDMVKPVAAAVAGALISGVAMYTVGAKTAQVDAFQTPALVQTVDGGWVDAADVSYANTLQPAVQTVPVANRTVAARRTVARRSTASAPTVYRTIEAPAQERRVIREDAVREEVVSPDDRSWQKTAMIIGGSAAGGAGVGGIVKGKKGALIGAAIGGGAASIYEATRRR